jgi:hypothetical protein
LITLRPSWGSTAPWRRVRRTTRWAARQAQLFAQQAPRQRGQKAQQCGGFQEARAGRVGHQHVAGAHRLQQAGHAQARVGAQLQRVEEFVVQPLEQAVHRLQALQRLEVQALVAHRQVAALDQGQAQVARQVGVLEIGFVVGAGRQQHDVRIGAAGLIWRLQAVDERAVGAARRCTCMSRTPRGTGATR